MLIEKQGNPDMAWVNPKKFEYRFECPKCGCVFRENGWDCWEVTDDSVKDCCPNCRHLVEGTKINERSGF